MFEDETPIAWTAAPRSVTVVAGDGTEIGTAESILGDKEEDIFHGIVLKRADDGEIVEVPAARIKKMTARHVVTDLATDETKTLPIYRDR